MRIIIHRSGNYVRKSLPRCDNLLWYFTVDIPLLNFHTFESSVIWWLTLSRMTYVMWFAFRWQQRFLVVGYKAHLKTDMRELYKHQLVWFLIVCLQGSGHFWCAKCFGVCSPFQNVRVEWQPFHLSEWCAKGFCVSRTVIYHHWEK